jgi:hypothetical protein
MKLTFRRLAILSAIIFFSLALVFMFAPHAMLSNWGVEFSYSAGLMARRGAGVFAGIGVMLFSARNAEPSPTRSALIKGVIVGCLILAALGVFELATGHAGFGILSAVLVEVGLTLAFLYVGRTKSAIKKGLSAS